MGKKVIAAGHICLDITPTFRDKKVRPLNEILAPGKLIHTGQADVHTGGSVANTGLAMKILGADVTLMGKIGKDAFGDIVLGILDKYHAAEGMAVSEKESTSYSVVLALPGIDRIFFHNPGANDTFQASDIPKEALEEAALFHFGYPPLMASMYRNEGEQLVKIMKQAKEAGAATSLDMAAIDGDCAAAREDWKVILKKTLPYVDFFVPSAEELCCMLDKDRFARWRERSGQGDVTEVLDVHEDIEPLAKTCMDMGARAVLIKCGAAGIYYRTAGAEAMKQIGERAGLDIKAWAGKEGFEKAYVPDRVLSGTGAGDTSIGAFLTSMLEGRSLEMSIKLAAATGASCVAAYDALSGLRPFKELEARINAGWQKQ